MINAMYQDLVRMFGSWPFSYELVLPGFFFWVILWCACGLQWICILERRSKKGSVAPVISREQAQYIFSKKGLWARFYKWAYSSFPIDGCVYFWRSLRLLICATTFIMFALVAGFWLVNTLLILSHGIYVLMLAVPGFIKVIPGVAAIGLVGLWRDVTGGVVSGTSFIYNQPLAYIVIGAMILPALMLFFLRSSAWKITRMRWKAFKEKNCPLIFFE